MKNRIIKTSVTFLLLLFIPYGGRAQSNTVVSQEKTKMENMWIENTENAAGGIIDAPGRVANAYIEYANEEGNFKRAQVGKKNSSIIFHTDGGGIYTNLKGAYLWGSFDYVRDDINDARWNASLKDPLRDMPFIIADSSFCKWKNQDYTIKFRAAYPVVGEKVYLGVSGTYEVADAAKQLDPRPEIELSNLNIIPSLVWRINSQHSVGANFHYQSYRESGSASTLNTLVDPTVWEMVSPGFFKKGVIGGLSSMSTIRAYNANALGGGVQYNYQTERVKILASANYLYKVEDAKSNYTKPRFAGTVRVTTWDIGLNARYNFNNDNSLYFKYIYSDKNVDGIEYFQTYDATYEIQSYIIDAKFIRSNFKVKTHRVNADYVIGNSGDAYAWKIGAEIAHIKDNFVYYVPESIRDIKTLDINAYVKYNLEIGTKSSLLIGFSGGYSANLQGTFDYNGVNSEDVGYTEFALLDYKYLSTSYGKMGCDVNYSYTGIKALSSLFVGGSINYYNVVDDDEFDHRLFLTLRVGITF